jgi:hypothetical protein
MASSTLAKAQNSNIYIVDEDKVTEFYHSFGTTAQSVSKDVAIIKEWLKTQLHLPELMGKLIFLWFALLL